MEFLQSVFSDQTTNIVLVLLIVAPIVDWISGSLRAIANGTFSLDAFDVFVRTQIAGRSVPLILLLILGRIVTAAVPDTLVIPGLDLSVFTGGGIAAAVPFLAVTIKSIIDNLNPKAPDVIPTVNEDKPA